MICSVSSKSCCPQVISKYSENSVAIDISKFHIRHYFLLPFSSDISFPIRSYPISGVGIIKFRFIFVSLLSFYSPLISFLSFLKNDKLYLESTTFKK